MKKFVVFFIVLLLSATPAHAVEIKIGGFWDMSYTWFDTSFSKNNEADRFMAAQRLRAKIDIITSENLRGVFQFETDANWGTMDYQGWASGGELGSDAKSVKVKSSFIDWHVPNTDINVRMGLQPVVLPGFVAGSNVFDNDIAGITVSAAINKNVAVVVAWGRAFNDNNLAQVRNPRDAADSFSLIVPITTDGFKLIPWVTYAIGGRDTDAFRIVDNGSSWATARRSYCPPCGTSLWTGPTATAPTSSGRVLPVK